MTHKYDVIYMCLNEGIQTTQNKAILKYVSLNMQRYQRLKSDIDDTDVTETSDIFKTMTSQSKNRDKIVPVQNFEKRGKLVT